ncbi:MAG: shikimate dehydrogenase, partial [Flavobacteriaceae bacterium]|nr:shikimate dehydrogenase [Flavobacteriaceae bacterium]
MTFGLLGRNISYSFSRNYFTQKFKALGLTHCSYEVFDIPDKEKIPELFENPDLKGFNITIPYKQDIIEFLDELSPEAAKIGAVNTVKIFRRKRKGFNTDAIGFKESLLPLLEPHHTSALVLGSGGASKAVTYVLDQLNIPYVGISRSGESNYASLTPEVVSSHLLLI